MAIMRLRRPKTSDSANQHNPLHAILNRDQRTILTVTRHRRYVAPCCETNDRESFECLPGGFSYKNRSRSRGTRRRFTRCVSRLGEVFIVGVCLLTVVRVPAVMSAPSTRHADPSQLLHSHETTEKVLSYLRPCGKSHEDANSSYFSRAASNETDPKILDRIMLLTRNALSYAEGFRNNYVEITFRNKFDTHHAHYANHMYDWLPNVKNWIPKTLGNAVSVQHMQSKTFDVFLLNVYEYLQRVMVGLEQTVVDQEKTQEKFTDNFRMMEVLLRYILCEIREALLAKNISPVEVPRSIMNENLRHLPPSYRNLRDWLIFRDLMNCLEYMIQVFAFIKENFPQSLSLESS